MFAADRKIGFLLATAVLASAGVAAASAPIASVAVVWAALGALAIAAVLRRARAIPRRPEEWLVAFALVALPAAPYLNQFGSYGTLLRLAVAGLLVALPAIGAVELNRDLPRGAKAVLLAFCAYQGVVLVAAPSLSYGLIRAVDWLMFVPLAFFRFRAHALRVVVAFTLLSGSVLAMGVLLQASGRLGGTWGGFQIAERAYTRRYTSFLLNPNDLGLTMIAVSLTALALATVRSGRARRALIATAAAAAIVMLLSSSRGALAAAVALVPFLALTRAQRTLRQLAVMLAAALLLTLAAVPGLRHPLSRTVASFIQIRDGRDLSVNEREHRWKTALALRTAPLIGSGYGGYATDAIDGFTVAGRQDAYRGATVDNSWLKLWLEEGAVGVLLLATLLTSAIRAAWRAARRARDATGIAAGGFLIALVVRSTSVDIFDINPWNFAIWLAVAIAFSLEAHRVVGERS
jgi:O-antigen ligase